MTTADVIAMIEKEGWIFRPNSKTKYKLGEWNHPGKCGSLYVKEDGLWYEFMGGGDADIYCKCIVENGTWRVPPRTDLWDTDCDYDV